jgi:hypothetical protein
VSIVIKSAEAIKSDELAGPYQGRVALTAKKAARGRLFKITRKAQCLPA